MKRRDFLNLTLGSAVAAIVPVPRGAAAPAAMAKASPKYVWAVAMARAQNRVSVELLQNSLKIGATEASGLMNRLIARGVIAAPNAVGMAKAKSPLFKGTGIASKTSAAATIRRGRTHPGLRELSKHFLDEKPAEAKLEGATPSEDPQETSRPLDCRKS